MTKYIFILLLPLLLLFLSGCAHNYIEGTEPKICPIHNIPLTKMIVPLEIGKRPLPKEHYYKAKEELFPNSKLEEGHGCVIGLKEIILPNRAKVLACEACNQAEKEWLKNNDKYDE